MLRMLSRLERMRLRQVGSRKREARAMLVLLLTVSLCTVPPFYFKPGNVKSLVECLADTASACPNTPFYYYHIPCLTNVEVSVRRVWTSCLDVVGAYARGLF